MKWISAKEQLPRNEIPTREIPVRYRGNIVGENGRDDWEYSGGFYSEYECCFIVKSGLKGAGLRIHNDHIEWLDETPSPDTKAAELVEALERMAAEYKRTVIEYEKQLKSNISWERLLSVGLPTYKAAQTALNNYKNK